jgi:GT2 family glycosyltransferase
MTHLEDSVLVLTPVKNAAAFLDGYVEGLGRLTYPSERLSLGLLDSDSSDGTFDALQERLQAWRGWFASVGVWKRDFGYRLPAGLPRWWPSLQLMRRAVLARSRNHLLFRALEDHDWVLWLDVDVVEYPSDVIERLLATGKRVVQPNCVLDYGGASFDRNAWRGPRMAYLSDLRHEGDLVELDSVGGTMLLVRADLHRDGLIFPPFPYGPADDPRLPRDAFRIETEGLGLMARDMGCRLWGMPNLEIRHYPA